MTTADEIMNKYGLQAPTGRPALTGQLSMAEKYTSDHADRLRYIHGLGWHIWSANGTHWEEDLDGAPRRALKSTLERRLDFADQLEADAGDDQEKKDQAEAVRKLVRGCCSASAMDGVMRIAKDLLPIAKSHVAVNKDPYLFNTPACTIDLHTGDCRPHSQVDMITKLAGSGPDPDADAGPFNAFIERILPHPQVRVFVQRLFGQALIGEQRDHILPVFHGAGANGKGTLCNLIMEFFGNYAVMLPAEVLLASKHTQHNQSITKLMGARIAFASETDPGRRLNASLVKQLTGGDPITAHRMHENDITWNPTHTLIMVTNYAPIVQADDDAMWRRVCIVPFDVVIPREEWDLDLPARLRLNMGAVANWVLEGYQDYLKNGIDIPEEVRVRTNQFRVENDTLSTFLEERVQKAPTQGVQATRMYTAYVEYCRVTNQKALSTVEFPKAMEKKGIFKGKKGTRSERFWQDCSLIEEFRDDGE